MNIFFLHRHPAVCAQLHCDKHVLKMSIEYAQLLSTAQRSIGVQTTYKSTHKNHPSAVWARSSNEHYYWLYKLWYWTLAEYTFRYGKVHACSRLLDELVIGRFGDNGWVDPPQCMPDQYKADSAVTAYQQYYKGDKSRFAKWKQRAVPQFMLQDVTVAQVRELHEKDRHEQDLADRSTRSA